jgi:hypothetical protein
VDKDLSIKAVIISPQMCFRSMVGSVSPIPHNLSLFKCCGHAIGLKKLSFEAPAHQRKSAFHGKF